MQPLTLSKKSALLEVYELLLSLTETAADGNVSEATPPAAADQANHKATRRGHHTPAAVVVQKRIITSETDNQ